MACGHFKCHWCWHIPPQQQSNEQTGGIEFSFQNYTTDISMTNTIYNKWMHSKKPTGLKAQLSRVNIFKEWNTNVTRQVEGNTTSLLVFRVMYYCYDDDADDHDHDEKHRIRTRRWRSWSTVRRPRPGWIHLPTDFILVFQCHLSPGPEALVTSTYKLAYPQHHPVN